MDLKINNKHVIVFDLDDTLYSELDYLKSAYKKIASILEKNNPSKLYAEMFSLYRNGDNVFSYLEDKFSIDIKELLSIYRNHFPEDIKLKKRVLYILKTLKKANVKMAIITDGRSITQNNKIKALGISDFFDKIIISEEVGTEKPDLNNYLLIENEFENHEYCYIADNLKKDFIIPNKRNWNSIALIDDGTNINNQSFNYINNSINCPKNYIFCFEEINIIKDE